jgi:hypothetical protein
VYVLIALMDKKYVLIALMDKKLLLILCLFI